jgi:hypothetical protein
MAWLAPVASRLGDKPIGRQEYWAKDRWEKDDWVTKLDYWATDEKIIRRRPCKIYFNKKNEK